MKAIWFVLVIGVCWEDAPLELGRSGRTAQCRLQAWESLGIWDRLHLHLQTLPRKAGHLDLHTPIIDSVIDRAFGGGKATGLSPVDRAKQSWLIVSRNTEHGRGLGKIRWVVERTISWI